MLLFWYLDTIRNSLYAHCIVNNRELTSNMLETVILQMINLSVIDYQARSGVGRLELARYMGCTPKTVARKLEPLITSGYIRVVKLSARRGNGFRYAYNFTQKGLEYLDVNYEQIKADFDAWQTQELIEEIRLIRRPQKTTKSKKQIKQENAGQRELF